jgi:DNA (cytosine-5)-methyltransferase 1
VPIRVLDAFCGAGGSSSGYARLGFQVTGVDDEQQPHFPFKFIQADAFDVLSDKKFLRRFDFVHAGPPCQAYSDLHHSSDYQYPDLIYLVRRALDAAGVNYVIENVDRAPLYNPIMLCGTMFSELRVIRHRLFESTFFLKQPQHIRKHPPVFTHDSRRAHYGKLDQNTSYLTITGGGNCSAENARSAMGIDWMSKGELNEAIPPAYTEFVGKCVLANLR